ncbi:type IV secretory system conjugative DNA transfer family protein [Xanthobacter autotrophicus]|uniref:type IV secretory system conjugative DNA transfer family protein n=1 Tax=Xanthobacter autotrophicus TaxID=280 RepID=UPI00372B85D4
MSNDLTPFQADPPRKPIATAQLVPQELLDRQGYEKGDFWFGRTLNGKPFGWYEDLNLLTCAGPRAGKGVGVVIPNLLLFPGSAVVIDPKGELASETAVYRRDVLGQKVVVLDPAKVANVPPELRGTYNPLAQLDPNDIGVVSAALTIAQGIVVPNPKAKEPFWDDTALAFIQSIILYMLAFFPAEKRTLMKLRETSSVGDWDLYQAFLGHMRQGPDGDPNYEGNPAKAFDMLLSEMFASDAFGGALREEAAKISQMGDQTRGNVLGNVRTHLSFLKEPLLWNVLTDDPKNPNTLNLSDLRNQEKFTTVYLCLPVDMMHQQGRWLRLVVMQINQYIQRTPFNKRHDRPVLMMIDEFFQLGPLPSIENMLTYGPGFGLRLWLIVQDIVQLKKNYSESWETILGACGIKQFFGINDLTTAKYLSELIGEQEIDVHTVSLTENSSETQGSNENKTTGKVYTNSTSSNRSSASGSSSGLSSDFSLAGKMGWNSARTSSSTRGGASSSSTSRNISTTTGANESKTQGVSCGYSIVKQARRIFRPEEALTAFTKQNLIQLLHVRDQGGMMLMRTPYYADPDLLRLKGMVGSDD